MTTAKDRPLLSDKLASLIYMATKEVGTYDPSKALVGEFYEQMTPQEYEIAHSFLTWVHADRENRKFGHNIKEVFARFADTINKSVRAAFGTKKKNRPFEEIAKDVRAALKGKKEDVRQARLEVLYRESFNGRKPTDVKPHQEWHKTIEQWTADLLKMFPEERPCTDTYIKRYGKEFDQVKKTFKAANDAELAMQLALKDEYSRLEAAKDIDGLHSLLAAVPKESFTTPRLIYEAIYRLKPQSAKPRQD